MMTRPDELYRNDEVNDFLKTLLALLNFRGLYKRKKLQKTTFFACIFFFITKIVLFVKNLTFTKIFTFRSKNSCTFALDE
ncbi:hypothetical protein D3C87_1819560 [compost metagenome]